MNRPVAPLQPQRLPVLSMPEPEHVDEEHEGSGGDTDEDDNAEWDPLGLGGVHADESKLTPPEIILLFLDWMCKHKLTDSAAKDLWTLMSTFMPEGVDLPAFHVLKQVLSKSELKYVQRLDLCPNDCIVYWDSKHLSRPYRHAHRDRCPVCSQPRYVNDPKDGKQRSAKTIFFFPVENYVRSLFTRKDLVEHILHDVDQAPEGHVKRSRGFQQKIRDNPHMNGDHRNLGLIGTTDGVPFFEDQRRGAWPFVLRCANLPDGLSMHMANCHLALLSANEFWEMDYADGVLRRKIRGPKSLKPHLSVLVDDLLAAYKKGVLCIDSSLRFGQPHRKFRCRCMLLYWTGDYPALALASGTHSKTCHWCQKKSSAAPECSRRVWDSYRQYLPADHVFRNVSAFYGPAEHEPMPQPRTHGEYVAGGKENEKHVMKLRSPDARAHGVFHKDCPYKTTGIKELSPLAELPMFDLTWDILMCIMHILPGIWKRHLFSLLDGERHPAPVKERKKNSMEENAALCEAYKACKQSVQEWQLDKATKAAVDQRTRALSGEPSWIRSNIEVFNSIPFMFVHKNHIKHTDTNHTHLQKLYAILPALYPKHST